MTAHQHDRFDTTTEDAWAVCRRNLAVHLDEMPEGDYVTITAAQASVGQHGQRPYVDVVGLPDRTLTSIAAVPSYLYPDDSAAVGADALLDALGWSQPGKPVGDGGIMDRTATASRDHAAEVADAAVQVFRSVWGVPHPSFLSAWGVGGRGRASGPVDLRRGGDDCPVQPADVAELRTLVAAALATRTNFPTTVKANGDISIGSFASEMYVCFGTDPRTITLHAPLLTGIDDRRRVADRMAWLDTLWTHVRFVLVGGRLFARLDIDTGTFVPGRLVSMINHLAGLLVRVDAEFATRLGGVRHQATAERDVRGVPRAPGRSDLPSSLQTLQTVVELTGSPADAATVHALCDASEIDALLELARAQQHRAEIYAHILCDERRVTAAVAWDVQGRTWAQTALSLQRAATTRRTYQRKGRGRQIALFDPSDEPALF